MDIIKICRIWVVMLLDISPYLYVPYETMDRKVINKLIAQCISAIYVTMVASLLYYCKFFKTLKLEKFKINPYYPCVDNPLLNGLQQYILFCVYPCKLIHKDPKVNDSSIVVLRE